MTNLIIDSHSINLILLLAHRFNSIQHQIYIIESYAYCSILIQPICYIDRMLIYPTFYRYLNIRILHLYQGIIQLLHLALNF